MMKGAIGFIFGLWAVLASGQAEAKIWWVTRAEPVAAGLRCRITSEELPEGRVKFVAVISAEQGGQIWSKPSMSLSYAAMKPEGGTLGPLRPELPYKWSGKRVVCEFVTDMAKVAEPNFCFAFCNHAEAAVNGVVRKTGDMDFICAKLSDFMGPEPLPPLPADAAVGKKLRGVALGLWASEATYVVGEPIRLRVFARRDKDSPITIGVGPSVFDQPYISVRQGGAEVMKIETPPAGEEVEDARYFADGVTVSELLPPGYYTLTWKTTKRESNTMKITVE